jgi:hypothetical protein
MQISQRSEAGEQWPRPHCDPTHLNPRSVVEREDRVARKLIEQPFFDHDPAAAPALFGRLEDQVHGALEIPGRRKISGGAEQHRRVPVVAAGVHAAVMGRAVGEIVQLLDRQRVHIGAQPNRTGRIAVANGADHPGAGEPAVYLAPELGQPGRDEVSGALLGKSELRMGMNIASDRSQLVVIVEHLGKDRHVRLFARRPARQSGTDNRSPMSAIASTG